MDHAVIMAGGVGTRFWPRSREDRPKQFLRIAGGRPMIAETVARLEGLVEPDRILVVTRASQVTEVRRACALLPPQNILAEPVGRNTAPCVALAAGRIRGMDPEGVMLCLPADHVIRPPEAFRKAARAALDRAREARTLLTFGVPPTHAATGFGYVEVGEETGVAGETAVRRVARFVEKPDLATAEEYVASGRYLWNSGMFAWRADTILEWLGRLLPDVATAIEPVAGRAGPQVHPDVAAAYETSPAISIDYGVLEKAHDVEVIEAPFAWDDVGSWSALARLHDADEDGNVALGRLLAMDSSGIVAVADEGHVIAALGVRDLVVVHTDDVTLVCPRDRAEEVKRIVDELEERGFGELA